MGTLNCTNIKDSNGNDRPQECKAWVNFNGTGTVAIRDDYGVDSITDNGLANYTINYTTSFSTTNYIAIGNCGNTSSDPSDYHMASTIVDINSSKHELYNTSGGQADMTYVFVTCFGN